MPRRNGLSSIVLGLLAGALFGACLPGCGSGGRDGAALARSTAAQRSGVATDGVPPVTPALRGLRGDEDDDDTAGELLRGGPADSDNDTDNDRKDNAGKGYYDSDDAALLGAGRVAGSAERQTLSALAISYFSAARAGDGVRACALIAPTMVSAIPEDYGAVPQTRGTTCPAVMTKIFASAHGRLTGGVRVTGVRIVGDKADVLVGSSTLPASFLVAERTHGAWRVDNLLGSPLP